MNIPILNRNFKHPADGWYHLEALGEHPNARAGVVQVIDAESAASIVNRFNAAAEAGQLSHGQEMLIDHEHFKHDSDKETRAYGWLQRLCNRADGIYGQIRWSATGQAAVDGGDYRFFSTEYDPASLQVLNREGDRVRPLALDGITLTNDPNNKGQRGITNRNVGDEPRDERGRWTDKVGAKITIHPGDHSAHPGEYVRRASGVGDYTQWHSLTHKDAMPLRDAYVKQLHEKGHVSFHVTNRNTLPGHQANSTAGARAEIQQTKSMKQIAQRLGLSADASEEAILGELTKLENRANKAEAALAPLATERDTLKNRVTTLEDAQAEADLTAHGITENDADRPQLKAGLLQNREIGLAFLKRIATKATETGKIPLTNRATAKVPGAAAETGKDADADKKKGVAIRNRAQSLQAANPKLTLQQAFIQAEAEINQEG